MKTLSIKSFALMLIAALTFLTSCKKEAVEPEQAQANIIGTWQVSAAEADVFYQGEKLANVEMQTSGTMEFKADGTGTTNFTMAFADDETDVIGRFTWVDEGFEVIVTMPDGDTERWAQIDDEKNLQTFQYTYVDEDDPDTEMEITLTLTK